MSDGQFDWGGRLLKSNGGVQSELGSERRETVRSLSVVGVGYLRGVDLSTRGPGRTHLRCISCPAKGIAG